MEDLKFLPYARHHIEKQDVEHVIEALQHDVITRGAYVKKFEESIASLYGVEHAVAFNSGSSALYAAFRAIDTAPGDRVFTSPNTFIATVGPAIQMGATPVFIDIEPTTGNLDLDILEENINTPSTRGRDIIVPVHFAGIPVNIERIEKMVNRTDTVIIEDAAHALGSRHEDRHFVGCCRWSDMAILSFHPSKTITTGEGGMVLTKHKHLYNRLLRIRNNGMERNPDQLIGDPQPWYYEVHELTGNYNFTDFQAALGISQLSRIEQIIKRRQSLVKDYRKRFEGVKGIMLPTEAFDRLFSAHLFFVQIDFEGFGVSRKSVMEKLQKQGFGTQVHYIPLYRHPVIKNQTGDLSLYFPKMEKFYSQALTLPLTANMTAVEVKKVVKALRRALGEYRGKN